MPDMVGGPGGVSVVVVDRGDIGATERCLDAVGRLDWRADQLELICVVPRRDREARARIRAAAPGVTLLQAPGTGYAGCCNLGVQRAASAYVGVLDATTWPDPGWMAAAVDVLDRDRNVGCVASVVLSADRSSVTFAGETLSWSGAVVRPAAGGAELGQARDVLFPSAAAMVVRRDAFLAADGLDERLAVPVAALDLGWRLNLRRERVRFIPLSVVVGAGRGHGESRGYAESAEPAGPSGSAGPSGRRACDTLLCLYKNYEDTTLARALPAAMALAVRRGDAAAVEAFVNAAPDFVEDRKTIQRERRVSDRDLQGLFSRMAGGAARDPGLDARRDLGPDSGLDLGLDPGLDPIERDAYPALSRVFGVGELFSARFRILVITADRLGSRMAGPAIRAWEIARALSREHDVILATSNACSISAPDFQARAVTGRELRDLEQWCDIIVFQGFVLTTYPWLRDSQKILVADLYDPLHLETLEADKHLPDWQRENTLTGSVDTLNTQLQRGDFFLCASGKQRDFWLGHLAGVGRVNPATYDQDETLEKLIAVAPFGTSDTPPVKTRPAIKGVVGGIGPEDTVILWGGGIYNWFDPLTLIRAVDRLRARRPRVRLFFLGLKHPNPDVPEMRASVAARDLSDRLGLTGRYVFFNEDWVAYEDRQNYLLEADIGVSCHLDHVETAFSFRTRILDYLWASVPIVATAGDTFGELITARGLGVAVPPQDVDALEEALFRLVDDAEFAEQCRKNVADGAADFTWSRALEPLVQFCRAPQRAPDLVERTAGRVEPPPAGRRSLRENIRITRTYLRLGGPTEVVRRAFGRIRRITRARLASLRKRNALSRERT